METSKLKAEPRQARGSRAAARLRRQGKLPAIVYGHGETPEHIAVDRHDLALLLEHGAHLVELQMDGKSEPALVKEVQYEYLGATPIHADFVRVSQDERVTVKVPLEFKGTAVGTTQGGMLDHDMLDIEIECLATDIPDSIRVNVAELQLGQVVHVRELELPSSVTAITPGETIVCSVRAKKAEVEAVAEAPAESAAAGPEIIGRKKEEEAEAAD